MRGYGNVPGNDIVPSLFQPLKIFIQAVLQKDIYFQLPILFQGLDEPMLKSGQGIAGDMVSNGIIIGNDVQLAAVHYLGKISG